jgi:hypothetical protein
VLIGKYGMEFQNRKERLGLEEEEELQPFWTGVNEVSIHPTLRRLYPKT